MENDEKKPRKERKVTPRHPLHQAVLTAVHEWIDKPFADNRDAMLKAMLDYKRFKFGDENITAL